MASRTLYLARHGDATETGPLSEAGRAQATALGARMAGVGLDVIYHGPLPRATETAAIVAAHCPGVPVTVSDLAGDYPPSAPDPAGLPDVFVRLLDGYRQEELTEGAALGAGALSWLTADLPGGVDSREMIITHSFLVGWLVRAALDGPGPRWLGLNAANAALTVIRCRDDRPPTLLLFNDLSHLPVDLHWTGFPATLRP